MKKNLGKFGPVQFFRTDSPHLCTVIQQQSLNMAEQHDIVPNLERRAFLGAGAFTIGGLLLPLPTWAHPEQTPEDVPYLQGTDSFGTTALYAEAGNYKRDPRFVVAMLSTTQENTDEGALANLRTSLNYRTKVTYHSTDKFKIPFCEAALDYFANTPSLRFSAKVFNWNGGGNDQSFGQLSLEKIGLYQGLSAGFSQTPTQGKVKSQSPYGPSIFFKDKYATTTGHSMSAVNARLSNLIQLAGLMAGCVLREQEPEPPQSSVKRAMIVYLKNKLGVSALTPGIDVGGGKFTIK